jgi:hypothetical protein
MVMFNQVQWNGDYNAAGASRLTADMANFGATPLHMRVAIRGGPGFTLFGSTTAIDLPPDGVWRPVSFDLTPSAMTNIGGADTLAVVLGSVFELRVLSAEAGPSGTGDPIKATLGMDNLRAVNATLPIPTSVVSRKLHSGLPFDIPLPLTGSSGIECRSGGVTNDYQVILTFANAVTFSSATLTTGAGSVSNSSGSGTATVTVNLAGVTNAQRIMLTVQGVNGAGDVAVPMGVLVGDTNGDGFVNAGDTIQTRNRSGQAADATNFRSDVNVDGTVNSGDTIGVRSRSGTSLP